MKFLSVTLSGILAYEDEVTVDLSATTPDKNLILIWGRNGKGKTSFITALKLLFAGIDTERSRLIGFPPISLPPGQYVLGDGDHWMGIINRRVRRRAAASGTTATASIQAVWESNGDVVTAKREWSTASNGAFAERVMISQDETRLTGAAARDRLADFLPPGYVGFFFFDGEDIKALAETAERKNIDFDQLLRITFVDDLVGELTDAAAERRRRTLKPEERKELRAVQRELDEAEYAGADATQQLRDLDDDLLTEQSRLRRAETIRDNLSGGATDAQRKELEQRRRKVAKSVDAAKTEIVSGRLPVLVPVLANLPLATAAISLLERRLDNAGALEQRLISRITTSLRHWIDAIDADLSDEQRDTIEAGLSGRLRELSRPAEDGTLLSSLDLDRTERLRATLAGFLSGGRDTRQAQAALVSAISRDMTDLEETEDRLMKLRVGSEANIEKYKENERLIRELTEKIASINQQKGVQTERLEASARAKETLTARKVELDGLAVRATRDEHEARFIERLVETLHETREQLRRSIRDEVQMIMQRRFRDLVFEHPLIARIEIDDAYTMNFFDSASRPIGRASLSSGLKQLAATALLWAMKEASGYDMPVIIDTPLGRIDRENQDNMLNRYYPSLSNQVIILPTNAEIDPGKRNSIADRIATEYSIDNRTGDSATILPGTLEPFARG